MEEELRQKIYQMHGSMERLEEKTDNMIQHQGRLDSEIDNLEEDISKVSSQAKSNQRKLYGVFLLGGAGTTATVVVATVFSGAFP